MQNPIILYKKGRNNNKRINPQNNSNNSCTKEIEKYIPDKNFSYNTMINFPKKQNISNNNILQKEEKSELNIMENMRINSNNSSKNTNYKNKIIDNKRHEKNDNIDKEIENKKESDLIEEKINENKKEMEDVKNNIEKLNEKMIDMKNTLDNIKIQKNEKKKEIQNLLSNKETLEEMYNMEIIFMVNRKNTVTKDTDIINCNINITIEEIKLININQLKIQIIELVKKLFNNGNGGIINDNNNLFINYLSNVIEKTYNIFNQRILDNSKEENIIISEFFDTISGVIYKYNNKFSISLISSLLHYLVKINCINQKIEISKNFINNNYKLKKEEINEELIGITFSLIFFENQKRNIINIASKLQDKAKKLQKNKKIEKDNNLINDNKMEALNPNKNNTNYDDNNSNNIFNSKEVENNVSKTRNYSNDINENNFNNNNLNGGNIQIRYDNNLNVNVNIFSEREEAKNKIYESYVNNGIALNDKKKRILKKFKLNFNSISGNISKGKKNIKEKEKIINEKKNSSTSFKYNFDPNFADLKIKKVANTNSDRKNFLILRKTFVSNDSKIFSNKKKNNSNHKLNKHKRKQNFGNNDSNNNMNYTEINKAKKLENKYSMNKNQRYLSNISNDYKKINNKFSNNNKTSQSKIKKNKSQLKSSESFLTNYKKKSNQRLSNFQKFLDKFISNSSNEINDNSKSMNNISKNKNKSSLYNNNDIFNSFYSKIKNISNIFINDFDDNTINNNIKNSKTNRTTYINTNKNKKKISDYNINDIKINIGNIFNENNSRKLSNINYEKINTLKLSNHNCNKINHNTNYNKMNWPNGFYSMTKELESSNQLEQLKKEDMQTFCFYKILDRNKNKNISNSKKYNPLMDSSINPEFFGYNESYISLDVNIC